MIKSHGDSKKVRLKGIKASIRTKNINEEVRLMKSLKKVFAFALATIALAISVYYITPSMKAVAGEQRYSYAKDSAGKELNGEDGRAKVYVKDDDGKFVYDAEKSTYVNYVAPSSSSSSSSSSTTTDTSVPVGTIAKDVPVTINGQTVAVTIVKSVDQTNTLLAGAKDAIPAGSSLSTVEAAEGTQTFNTAKSILAIYRPNATIAKVFNFNVFSKDAKPVKQANGKVAISIPIPEGLSVPAGMVLKVYKFNDDGTVTVCDCIIDNGRVVCGTDSFGTFAFVYEKASKKK